MADDRDLIRSRVNIVELITERIPLQKRGKYWTGLCPFHDDTKPSFQVSDLTGTYICWACKARGDIFTWVMETQKMDFREAMELLADRIGHKLSRGRGSNASETKSKRQQNEGAMKTALAFFRAELQKSEEAQAYCVNRGITPEVIDAWELGYGPVGGEALTVTLQKAGYPLFDCQQLFLVDGDQQIGYSDRFKNRLIFPIRDERGALVGFGGRVIGDGIPKYINSSDTPLYSKRRVLYGLYQSRQTVEKSRRVVLTEGYLDVIACHRAGVSEAVASLGTSLSEDHARLLKRWCDDVVILYDSDAAGEKAAQRASELLKAEGLRVKVALMPPGDDPDTLLKTAGPDAVRRAVDAGCSPSDFQFVQLRKRESIQSEAFWKEAVAILATIDDPLERERHIIQLSGEYPDLKDPLAAQKVLRRITAQALKARKGPTHAAATPLERPVSAPLLGVEKPIMRALFDPQWVDRAVDLLAEPELLVTGTAQRWADVILAAIAACESRNISVWIAHVEDPEIQLQLEQFALLDWPVDLTETAIDQAVDELRRRRDYRGVRQMARDKSSEGHADEDLARIQEELTRLKSAAVSD